MYPLDSTNQLVRSLRLMIYDTRIDLEMHLIVIEHSLPEAGGIGVAGKCGGNE